VNKYVKIVGSILAFGLTVTAIVYRKEIYKGAKNLFGFGIILSCNDNVLLVGDSTTNYNPGYAEMLQNTCVELKIKKLTKVGATTNWMLGQLKAELDKGSKYDAIVINGGVNDIYAGIPAAETIANLDSMYSLAAKSGAKLIAITPVASGLYTLYDAKKQAAHDSINSFIKKSSKVDHVADWYSILGGKTPDKKLYAPDGLHPDAQGHEALKNDLFKLFKP